jgi:ferritin-like metal-binding protein YciE
MLVRIEPLSSFIAAPGGCCSIGATTILTRGGLHQTFSKDIIMTNEHFRSWYVDGLQAMVSASEISEKAASANGSLGISPKLKSMLASGAKIATEHTETIRALLQRAGGKPTSKPDKVMQGIAEAGKDIVDAADDPQVIDAAVIATTQIGLHYYVAAYGTLAIAAKQLGLNEDAAQFERMNDHIKEKDAEYTALRKALAMS